MHCSLVKTKPILSLKHQIFRLPQFSKCVIWLTALCGVWHCVEFDSAFLFQDVLPTAAHRVVWSTTSSSSIVCAVITFNLLNIVERNHSFSAVWSLGFVPVFLILKDRKKIADKIMVLIRDLSYCKIVIWSCNGHYKVWFTNLMQEARERLQCIANSMLICLHHAFYKTKIRPWF